MSDGSSATMALLLAESDSQLRHLFQLLLRPHYNTIIEAPNATLALETLRTHADALVVVWDLWLSYKSTPHVLDAIEHEPAIRRHAFVLLAAEPEALTQAARRRAQRLGIPVLRMPFELEDFFAQVALARQTVTAPRQAVD